METENKLRLADVFVSISDPRQRRKVEHDLVEVLVVAVNAVLVGADTFVEIELWAKEKQDWLRQPHMPVTYSKLYLERASERGVPPEQVLRAAGLSTGLLADPEGDEPAEVGAADPRDYDAEYYVRVLRDTLGGARSDSDFLLARGTLSDVLPDPALAQLGRLGASIELRNTALAMQRGPDGAGQSRRRRQPERRVTVVGVGAAHGEARDYAIARAASSIDPVSYTHLTLPTSDLV